VKTKTLQLILSCALAAAAASPALAQTAAPPASSNDPVVQARMGQREANAAYASGLIKAHADRSAKVHAAVEAAVKEADEKGKDPLVAKRDADAKARKATQAEYDAQLKKLADARKAAMAEADKKMKAGKA
jgi:hypothetical protein